MSVQEFRNWRSIREEVLRRIEAREWEPGDVIPREVALADEFNCARATVNRALRSLSDEGILERRRKAGTRVAELPTRRATLDISILRLEIEAQGQHYGHQLLAQDHETALPPDLEALAGVPVPHNLLHLRSLHLADGVPYALEERWINLETAREAEAMDFREISPNEWLVNHVPYTACDFTFSAMAADPVVARSLKARSGQPLFRIDRTTRQRGALVTAVCQIFPPGYRLRTGVA
ncbi:GntR family transcriptional regulator [Aliiruegeria haliotis]|uniref:GntR family transcriptional regulator n=1 Tax=Aliiruegeria haliotis TaxID=1280846 RepID=A0A2T0RWN5_9RHOB|nr:GntR family transcriptional regulator [Aliiruegeria haliotis]PRY25463.1 GntR family transcriptional regulator [Aliiruegeria haliotis]